MYNIVDNYIGIVARVGIFNPSCVQCTCSLGFEWVRVLNLYAPYVENAVKCADVRTQFANQHAWLGHTLCHRHMHAQSCRIGWGMVQVHEEK